MSDLTDAGRAAINDIAARYGVSSDAVEQMARSVARGGGAMAQFNIPEFGGSGQWMAGGMIMVGDMFNHGLQAQVGGVCTELSAAMANAQFFIQPARLGSGGDWWPSDLGAPASVGGQNQMRYAYFPGPRRLVVDRGDGGPYSIYDTGDHQIGGFSQQQSGYGDPLGGLTFSSQFGQYAVSSLPLVSPTPVPPQQPMQPQQPDFAPQPAPFQPAPEPSVAPEPTFAPDPSFAPTEAHTPPPANTNDVLETIARLAALRDGGALTEEEFAEKKRELLARL